MFNDIRNVYLLYKYKAPNELKWSFIRIVFYRYGLLVGLLLIHAPILIPLWLFIMLGNLAEMICEWLGEFYEWIGLKPYTCRVDERLDKTRDEGRKWYNANRERLKTEGKLHG